MKSLFILLFSLLSVSSQAWFILKDDYASDPYEVVKELEESKILVRTIYETDIIGLNGCMRAKSRAKKYAKELCLDYYNHCKQLSSEVIFSYRAVPADENFYLSLDPGKCEVETIFQGSNYSLMASLLQ